MIDQLKGLMSHPSGTTLGPGLLTNVSSYDAQKFGRGRAPRGRTRAAGQCVTARARRLEPATRVDDSFVLRSLLHEATAKDRGNG